MIASNVQKKIDAEFNNYFELIVRGQWTLQHAHAVLTNVDAHRLNLFQVGGLAKAIAVCQCADEQGIEY